jgi:hypothetical protein
MSKIEKLSEKELQLLQADVPEIIEYLINNKLISGKKKTTKYVFEDQIYETEVYNPYEVIKISQKLAFESEDSSVLKLLLKTKNALVLHSIPYNKNIFKEVEILKFCLESDKDLIFDLYCNPHLPDYLIEDRIEYIKKTYQALPTSLYDKLFYKDSNNIFINLFIGLFGKLERELKRLNTEYGNRNGHDDLDLFILSYLTSISEEELKLFFE